MKFKKIFLTIFIIALLLIITIGCSKVNNPEDTFEAYLLNWEKQEFNSMYEALSTNSKEYISQDEFLKRYENIYGGIEAKNISINIKDDDEEPQDKEDNESIVPFTLLMDTVAGKVEFSHEVKLIQEDDEDGKKWAIEWNESMIFPQMVKGDSVRVETIAAQRGEIHDRNGSSLAKNGEIQIIGIQPQGLGNSEDVVKERLAQEFKMSIENVDNKLNASWVQPDLFVPIGSLPSDEKIKLQELTSLPGVLTQKKAARVYPFKEVAAHLIGYVAAINNEELEQLEGKGYNQNSIIGKTGLESIYEDQLKAIDGKVINIIKEDNSIKETIAKRDAKDGKDIQLTIDANLQRKIYNEMKEEQGTTAAINPKTGEVIALVNSPSYDPNAFVLGLSEQQWDSWNKDPKRPLLNRFSLTYSPGSVFKPITAAIGIEQGKLEHNKSINISGLKWQKDSSWGDYNVTRVKDSGKPIDLKDALVYSDNIYFAMAALDIGEKPLIEGGESFGIGEEIPFNYSIKASQISNDDNFSGDIQLADSGYGQGEVALSPLHLSTIYTAFLNEGNIVKPILNIEDVEGTFNIWKENVISKETANLLKDYMVQVIEHPQGTGRGGRIDGLTLGGKTGTAELKGSSEEEGQENGWFIAFDDSNIVITMMLEDVGEQGGSAYVVPKVKRVLEGYLK
jgi:penicillin-binding protein